MREYISDVFNHIGNAFQNIESIYSFTFQIIYVVSSFIYLYRLKILNDDLKVFGNIGFSMGILKSEDILSFENYRPLKFFIFAIVLLFAVIFLVEKLIYWAQFCSEKTIAIIFLILSILLDIWLVVLIGGAISKIIIIAIVIVAVHSLIHTTLDD